MKLKYLHLLLIIICCLQEASAQLEPEFLKRITSERSIYIIDLTTDSDENCIISGKFYDESDFDFREDSVFTMTSNPSHGNDGFVAKYDNDGKLLWAWQYDESEFNDNIYEIRVDHENNIYASSGYTVTKLSVDGEQLWQQKLVPASGIREPIGERIIHSFAFDSMNNIYGVGGTLSNLDMDPGAGEYILDATTGTNTFIFKWSSEGTFVWARAIGAPANATSGNCNAYDVTVIDGEGVFVTGEFTQRVDFDPSIDSLILESALWNRAEGYIVKLSENGTFKQVSKLRRFNPNATSPSIIGTHLGKDSLNHIYWLFRGSSQLIYENQDQSSSLRPKGVGVLKLDADLNFIWSYGLPASNNETSESRANDFIVAPDGTTYVRAHGSTSDIDFNQDGISLASGIYLSGYDPMGNFKFAHHWQGPNISRTPKGDIFSGGPYTQPIWTTIKDSLITLDPEGHAHSFLYKLSARECQGGDVDYYVSDHAQDIGDEPNTINLPYWNTNTAFSYHLLNGNPTPQHIEEGTNYMMIDIKNLGCNEKRHAKIALYYTINETGLSWPDKWSNYSMNINGQDIVAGNKLGELEIPTLLRNESWRARIRYDMPIDPEIFSTGTTNIHFLYRIESDEDTMSTSETSNILFNVIQNNNLAWKTILLK